MIGLVTGLVLAGMVLIIGALVIAKLGEGRPSIANDGTLILRLEGPIPERAPIDTIFPLLGGTHAVTVVDVWQSLRRAAADPKVKAVVLMPRALEVGWAKLQEIRGDLQEFKKSGKPLLVFLRAPRTPEYYLATAADKIYMVPEDILDMKGLRAELTYFTGAMEKVGVKLEAEHAGKYKDALDSFTRTSMTPETREVLNSMLDGLYGDLIHTVSTARKMTLEETRSLIDNGPFLAEEAVKNKLVDATLYEDQFFDLVSKAIGGAPVKRIALTDYVKAATDEGTHKIAVIVSEGGIIRGGSVDPPFSTETSITVANSVKTLRQVGSDESIRGVILRVDSPGGDAVASDEILREVKLLSKKKPLIISMSDVAASGGYYISMTGDPVLAYPNTITGSIGVIFGKINLRGLYEKLGVKKEVVQRGENATIDSEYFELTPEGRTKLRNGVESVYKTFVQIVADSRKKEYAEIHQLAQGRVWLGSQAKENGLVDELGGLDRAMEMIKDKAKIGRQEQVQIVVYPPRRTLLDQLFTKTAPSDDNAPNVMIRKYVHEITGLPLEMWEGRGFLKLMPFRIEAR